MSAYTITGCRALLGEAMECPESVVDVFVLDGRIARVLAAGTAPPEGEVIDGRSRLLVPGLINGHHHSHEHFHKGRYDRLPLELWMNYVRPFRPIELSPREVYLRTMIGAIQALRSGTTCLMDDMNVSPVLHREHVEAAYQAYEDIGIRALMGMTLFDKPFFESVPYVEEEFPPELLRQLRGTRATPPSEVLAYARELARSRHPREHRVGYLATPSAPQRCTEGFLREVRAFADDFDLPLVIHVQETRMQVVTGQLFYGSTMVEYLDRIDFLKPATSLIHAVWLTPGEIARIAHSGASVQHNPNSNFKLGSGLAPLRALLDAGVNVSLGTDGCGSIETLDMLRVVANTALVHKLRGDDHTRWIGAEEAWHAGTVGGARAIGMSDRLGVIEAGREADFVLYRLDSIAFTPLNAPLRQLVYAETGAAVDTIFVAGEPVMRGGALTRVDEAALLAEITEAAERIRPLIEESESMVGTMSAAYARIHARCACQAIAPDTYPARLPDGPG